MCKLKSGIILKDRVFVPEYDSHSDMLKELGIKDNYFGASKKFVRVELSPKNGDVFTDIDTWEYNVDQDILPDWYDEAEAKPRMVEAVKEWAKGHIHLGKDKLTIDSGCGHYIKDCTNVDIEGNATVSNIHDNATASYIYGNATVSYICGNAVICSSPYTVWANAKELIIKDCATFKDNYNKVIYQSGGFKFVRLIAEAR